jgi:CheY-like chemotaxis protein
LIVDAAEETRDVLQTALEHRGLKTLTANRIGQGLAMAQEHRPELIVLDLEIDGGATDDIAAQFTQHSPPEQASLVLLGSVHRRGTGNGDISDLPERPGGCFAQIGNVPVSVVAKPYHYAPLIRRIEAILSARPAMASGQVDKQRAG